MSNPDDRSVQSRINGAKSRGPKSPKGKARSSRNSFKHGRFANNAVVLGNEDGGAFEELVHAYIQRICPLDPVEMRLTRELASIDWRLARILALDTRLLDHEMDIQAPALELENPSIPELTRLVLARRTVVDKSRFPTYLADRETRLMLARRETLRALQSLRKDHPRAEPAAEIEPPTPLDPEADTPGGGFRRSRTLIPEGSRTAFRGEPEHHRSVATLASRLCNKCSASSRQTCPERNEGRMPLAEKGARG